MKQIFIIALVLFSFNSFSQENYKFKKGGKIIDNNNEIVTPTYLRSTFSDNKEFLKLYNAGRTKKNVGNIFLYTGISTLIIKQLSAANNHPTADNNGNFTVKKSSNVAYILGAGLIIAAIPIKVGYSKKIQKSVEVLNSPKKNPIGYIESMSFIYSSNGIGIRVSF